MQRRNVLLVLALVTLLALTLPGIWGALQAQPEATQVQQTVDAAVRGFFAATATQQAAVNATLTAQITPPTMTPTLNLTQTIQAAFEQALKATDAVQLATRQAVGAPPEVRAALEPLLTELVAIPGGTFPMGTTPAEAAAAVRTCVEVDNARCTAAMTEDSFPQHTVTVDAFAIELTEVTNQQYLAFLNALGAGSHRAGCGGFACIATRDDAESSSVILDGATYSIAAVLLNQPIRNVSWHGANAYCAAVGRRLPTEAEWERAARGDDARIYPWGNEWSADLARTSIPRSDQVGPVTIGSYPLGASPYGLLDMAGNVAEWVSDWYDPRYYYTSESNQPNPQGAPVGESKVLRGGSWDAVPFFARTMHRQFLPPTATVAWAGFRCAADVNAGVTPTPRPTFDPNLFTPMATATPKAAG